MSIDRSIDKGGIVTIVIGHGAFRAVPSQMAEQYAGAV
jgi:hypothetical protein